MRLFQYTKDRMDVNDISNLVKEDHIIEYKYKFSSDAQEIIDLGFSILPLCRPINGRCSCKKPCGRTNDLGKKPLIYKPVQNATQDIEQLEKWRSKFGQFNFGLAIPAGTFVLDVDDNDALEEFERKFEKLPDTLTVVTGKGTHYFFRTDQAIKSKIRWMKLGIDILTVGRYVVGPGSLHRNGREYFIDGFCREITECPRWLLDLINPPSNGKLDGAKGQDKANQKSSYKPGEVIYEGTRHNTLHSEAVFYRDSGIGINRTRIYLEAVNEKYCRPALPSKDITAILHQVFYKQKWRPNRFNSETHLTKRQTEVLNVIERHINVDGHCNLSQEEIGALACVTTRSVTTTISKLKTLGYLEVERIGTENRYRVNTGNKQEVSISPPRGFFRGWGSEIKKKGENRKILSIVIKEKSGIEKIVYNIDSKILERSLI